MVKNYLCIVKTTRFLQNYFNNPKSLTGSFFAVNEKQKNSYSFSLSLSLMVSLLFTSFGIYANVGITVPSGTTTGCSFPTNYTVLGNIVINESSNTDFSMPTLNASYTLVLTAPTNFAFKASVGNIANTGNGDITGLSMVVTASTITITYSSNNTNRADEDDIITISNIEFRSNGPAGSGNILRLGASPGTGTIAGITNGSTNFGTLTSNLTAPAITSQPSTSTQSVCQNTATAAISVVATGAGLTYQWFSNTTPLNSGGINLGAASGAQTTTYTPQNTVAGTLYYYCVVSGTCTPAAISNVSGSVTIKANPVISAQPIATSICNNGTGSFSVVSTGTTFQWQFNNVNITDNATYSGTNSATLNITNPSVNGNYRVIVGNAGGCSTTSVNVALTVTARPSVLATPTSPANNATGICNAGVGATTQISWGAAVGATGYDVYFGTTTTPPLVSSNQVGTTWTITPFLAANTLYYWKIVPRNGCGTTTATPVNWSFTTNTLGCYCIPSVSNGDEDNNYITQVNFIGNITNTNNSSTYSSSPRGYQNFTTLGSRATQAQGEGVNIFVDTQVPSSSTNYLKAWVDWNRDGTFDDTTEMVYQCTSAFINTAFGFAIPVSTLPGDYRIRLRINRTGTGQNAYTSCGNISREGETEDYLFTVITNCAAKITSITPNFNCGTGSVTLGADSTAPGITEYRWYNSVGTLVGTSLPSPSATTWSTPAISATTTYYVKAWNGTCESLSGTAVVATIKSVPTLSFSNPSPEICGENSILDLTATGVSEEIYLVDETFDSGLGKFHNNQIASPTPAITNWQVRTSTYVPAYPTYPVWYPAVSSGFGSNNFAMSTSDLTAGGGTAGKVEEALELTTAVNTNNFTTLNLSFRMYFSSYYDDNNAGSEVVYVEYHNGTAWQATPIATFLVDVGIGTQFVTQTINMSAYRNITAFKFRIRYRAGWCDGVALDDIKLYGERPLTPSFTWTSGLPIDAYTNAGCTIPYVAGTPVTTVYVKPTLAQLETSGYSFTANANLTNGCTSSGTINVTNKSKVWKGTDVSAPTDWNVAANWMPAVVPTANDCVVIPTGTTVKIMHSLAAQAKNLTVKAPAGNLEIQSGKNLIVTDWVHNEGGVFNIRNNASLIQINPVANTGNINMERTANVDFRDYVYWSTPVTPFAASNISPTASNTIYKWIPTTGGINGFGNWVSGNENMIVGMGYIERGLNAAPLNSPVNFTANFIGVPNNGNLSVAIARGTYVAGPYTTGVSPTQASQDDDNWNLIGNPYPSAISANAFLTANAANLDGYVKVWRHGFLPTTANPDPFYNNYGYNYNASDYLTYNLSGPSFPGIFDGLIGAGQSFITRMKDTSPATTGLAVFNNTMRNSTYRNDQFFRTANTNTSPSGRIWLDLVSPTETSTSLVAYVDGATNEKDQMYDAGADLKSPFYLYSLIGYERLTIQGRALPFSQNDEVPLAIKVAQNGNYTLAINTVDGLFTDVNQNIFLEDRLLNVTHNLRSAPYHFTSNSGEHINRFVLKYAQTTLGNEDFDLNNSVKIFANSHINITSAIESIKGVTVYDVLGKTLVNKTKLNGNEFILNELNPTQSALIVKVTLENNTVITKKVIF